MKKKTITGLIILLVLVTVFSFSTEADIFSTIGTKGLSFASPGAANAVEGIIKLHNPSAWVEGYVTQQISEAIIQEITKKNPEAAKAIQQYNQVKGWMDQGAQITEDLKLDNEGEIAGGEIILAKEQDLTSIVNSEMEEGSTKAADVKMSSKGEGEPISFTSEKDGSRIDACGNTYGNLKEGSTLSMGRDCEILEADITTTKESTYVFGGKQYKVPEGGRIVKYEDGTVELFVEAGETVEVGDLKVTIGEGSTKFDGSKITGEDFIIDGNKFSGEVTVADEGLVLGKDTTMESNVMTINSEEGNLLYSTSCQGASGFDNYVSACGERTLTMQGEGFSVQLEEGKNFGLNIEKDDVLKYELDGGKVVLDKGEQTISTAEGKTVTVTNGDFETKYATIDGKTQILMNPDSIGMEPDVDITTKYADLVTIDNSETGVESCYVCPEDMTAGAAVTKVTAAASILERCKTALGLNTGEINGFIGPGKIELFEGETVLKSEIGPSFRRPDGSEIHTRRVVTKDKMGFEHKYSLSSDGSISEWDAEKLKWVELKNEIDPGTLSDLGVPQITFLRETPLQRTSGEASLAPIEAMEQKASEMWEKRRMYVIKNGIATENQYFVGPLAGGGKYMYLQPAPVKGLQGTIRNSGFLVEIIKDSKGNVIRYEAIGNTQRFKLAGGGKVELVSN